MKRLGLAVVVAGLLVGALASPALAAGKTRIQISGTNTYLVQTTGTQWFTGNIVHDRGDTNTANVTGSLSGTSAAVINFNLNVVTGAGPMWGTAVITLNSGGGFNCIWYGAFVPGTGGNQYTFTELCLGYGTRTGWLARMDTIGVPTGFTYSGYEFKLGS